MIEPNLEVEQAVSALAAEILKLSPTSDEARDALGVTIENALTRLTIAILAQADQTQEKSLDEAISTASA